MGRTLRHFRKEGGSTFIFWDGLLQYRRKKGEHLSSCGFKRSDDKSCTEKGRKGGLTSNTCRRSFLKWRGEGSEEDSWGIAFDYEKGWAYSCTKERKR